MCSTGDCFVVLPPNSAAETVIFGRNAQDETAVGVAQEVYYYDANEAAEGKCDGGADVAVAGETLRIILQKPKPGVWGGDCGANEQNVCVGVTWTAQEPEDDSGQLSATDIVRYTLAQATTAAAGVERIGELVQAHMSDEPAKCSFVVCDPTEAWLVSCAGKLWAAECLKEGHRRVPGDGLAVTTTIDKSSEELGEALKALTLWDGESELNFASAFEAVASASGDWSGDEPVGDGSYTLTSMFSTLRAAAQADCARSATVSVLSANGISCHWFTATPNASESVFKPFVFAPHPKISPLTKVPGEQAITLLHKLHGQRKPAAVADLKALEAACVDELNGYFAEHPTPNEELDELMKDCVEAEVKFYR